MLARLYSPSKASICRSIASNGLQDIKFENSNLTGIIIINRPEKRNTLNTNMIKAIYAALKQWEENMISVIIKGNGEEAFCAGGDLKQLKADILRGNGREYFWNEYRLIATIGYYKIPYIAFMDKITIGAGAGLSIHGRYRIATERTLFAMPEGKIGYFTDVGGSHFFPRLRDSLGIYLCLTGYELKGQDVCKAGLATHFVPSNQLNKLQTLLTKCSNEQEIIDLITDFSICDGEFTLAEELKNITYCFSASTIEEIYLRLQNIGNKWSENTINSLNKKSPTSLKISLKALQIGSQLNFLQCIQMEYRLSCRVIDKGDFIEGIRCFIEKDNKPKWNPKSLAEVKDEDVAKFFKMLPRDEELHFT